MAKREPARNPDRRTLLQLGTSWVGCLALEPGLRRARAPAEDPLDAALARLHADPPGPNLHHANHVPMAVEALAVLGREAAILPWLAQNLDPAGAPMPLRATLDATNWRAALSRPERFADWQALFLRELSAYDWRAVLRRWAPRLAPGLAGAATHGVIRCGHAARAVGAKDSELRRRELATGLAYWAASYQELPWDGSLAPEPSVEAALATLTLRQPAVEPPGGNFAAGLTSLDETPSFLPVAGRIDVRDPAATLHEITAAFAQRLLQNPGQEIALTHAVTAPSAVRLLLPALDEEGARLATRHAWQAAAGLLVVYGQAGRARVEPRTTRSDTELIDTAVALGNAHGIKLTEACLREDAAQPDPVYRAAAQALTDALKG